MLGLRKRGEQRAIQALPWGVWQGEEYAPTWSGAHVDASTSTQLLTVYGCVRLIADSIATLPVDVFRKTADGREGVPTPVWLSQPSADLDWTAWAGQVLTSLLLDGNAFALKVYADNGQLRSLLPIDPTKVAVEREQGRKVFRIGSTVYSSFDVLHIAGVMFPGSERGMSPVEAARQSIGLGLAAQEHGARFFGQGTSLPGVLESPHEVDDDQARFIAKQWQRRHGGKSKHHLPAVLPNGLQWKPTGITNEQAQFLQTRQFTAAEIAGQMFLVDPSDLGIGVAGTSLTYANIVERNLRRVQVTLLPWIVRLEHALSELLAAPRYVKLNVNGLLRADTKTRYEGYQIGINAGFLHREEPREWEDLPPRDDLNIAPEAPSQETNDEPV